MIVASVKVRTSTTAHYSFSGSSGRSVTLRERESWVFTFMLCQGSSIINLAAQMIVDKTAASVRGRVSGEVNLFLKRSDAPWLQRCRMNSCWLQLSFVHSSRHWFSPKAFLMQRYLVLVQKSCPKPAWQKTIKAKPASKHNNTLERLN